VRSWRARHFPRTDSRLGRCWRLMVVVALCSVAAGCARPTPVGFPTRDVIPGTCKMIETADEMVALSDVSPSVPCAGPHVYETYAVAAVPSSLTGLADRPGPELLQAEGAQACPLEPIRPYLGATDLDSQWGITVWRKFPTRDEWRKNVRVVVCDLVLDAARSDQLPVASSSLRNILRYADSARVRHCRTGEPLEDTTCDRPHLGEDMGSVPTPAANSAEELETAAGLACASRLADYTGQPAVVGFGVQYDFQSSGMTCWLTSTGGEVTGTRRSGLMSR